MNGRTYWDRHAKNYDLSMKLFGGPLAAMVSNLEDLLRGAGEVIEVAAGTGIATVALGRVARRVVATDYSERMVAKLRERVREEAFTNVDVEHADIENLRFGDGRFDAAVATNVLHLVPDLDHALRELARVVRPGGMLVVPTYCHAQTLVARAASRGLSLTGFPGRRRLTLAELRSRVVRVGLDVAQAKLLPGLLPIGFVAARKSELVG